MNLPKNISVLLIDDDPGITRLISKKLGSRGWSVDTSPTGEEGILKYLDDSYDVILVDYDIQGCNGIQVIRNIQEHGDTPPIILMTGTGSESIVVEALKLGIDDYIVKDLSDAFTELMISIIEKALVCRIEIREKEEFEQQLIQSKEKYRNLIENLNEIIFNLDRDGVLTYISPVVTRLYRYHPEELIGKHFSTLLSEGEYPETQKDFINIVEGATEPSELRILDKEGNIRDVQASSRRIYQDGEVVGLTGTLRDITELKQAHRELGLISLELGERVKELRCLYTISNFVEKNENLGDIYQKVVDSIPPSWRYPENTCARITVGDMRKTSTPFQETRWSQSEEIVIPGKEPGVIEVFFMGEPSEKDVGPFSEEELLKAI